MRTVTYDPFEWRHAELTDPSTNPLRRSELIDALIVWEAEEIAVGRRHLTIVHGEPTDIAASVHLDAFYDTARAIADQAQWSRLAGGIEYLTVTLAGTERDRIHQQLAEMAHQASPGWRVLDAPFPITENAGAS